MRLIIKILVAFLLYISAIAVSIVVSFTVVAYILRQAGVIEPPRGPNKGNIIAQDVELLKKMRHDLKFIEEAMKKRQGFYEEYLGK